MAKVYKRGDPLLVGHYGKRGELLMGVRRSGDVIVRFKSGAYRIEGKVRPGLTVPALQELYEKRRGRFEEVKVFDDLGGAPVRCVLNPDPQQGPVEEVGDGK